MSTSGIDMNVENGKPQTSPIQSEDVPQPYVAGDPAAPCDSTLTMYLFVLRGLGEGKAISQAGHVVHTITSELESRYWRSMYESIDVMGTPDEQCMRYRTWCEKPAKVALSATPEQLSLLRTMPEATAIVDEEGDPFLAAGTLVCVGFAPRPANSLAAIRSHHKLVRRK